ncbi:DUF3540 domain-containing protein [Variovorax sp. RB2P76]|uniref:DUF3540 domain-containing protein n=1 Tax=Variovorax sp. RB2P76 TaxID=3443736 RepID=UPI003F470E8E
MNDTTATSAAAPAPAPSRGRRRQPAEAIGGTWCVGILAFDAAGRSVVTSGALHLRAARAASCLLEPAAGDSVACLRIAPDEVWIMAVLQREEGTANVVGCPGNLRIAVEGGALDIDARQLRVSADTAELVGRQLSVVGNGIKLVGSVLSSVMDRVQHFSRHYLRTTEGIDRVAATHVEVEAKQLMRLEGEHTLVNGRELIKARGAQIHFG